MLLVRSEDGLMESLISLITTLICLSSLFCFIVLPSQNNSGCINNQNLVHDGRMKNCDVYYRLEWGIDEKLSTFWLSPNSHSEPSLGILNVCSAYQKSIISHSVCIATMNSDPYVQHFLFLQKPLNRCLVDKVKHIRLWSSSDHIMHWICIIISSNACAFSTFCSWHIIWKMFLHVTIYSLTPVILCCCTLAFMIFYFNFKSDSTIWTALMYHELA